MSTAFAMWIAFALVAAVCAAIIIRDERHHRREIKRIRAEFDKEISDRKRIGL